jgi:hypothetical protein
LPMISMLRPEPVWVVAVIRMRSTCPLASRDRPDTLHNQSSIGRENTGAYRDCSLSQ